MRKYRRGFVSMQSQVQRSMMYSHFSVRLVIINVHTCTNNDQSPTKINVISDKIVSCHCYYCNKTVFER